MGHMVGQGFGTSMKGAELEAVRITGMNVANGQLCTIAEDCKSGLVASVTHTSAGVYTFQLSIPFPPKVVTVNPKVSAALATSAYVHARYQSGSYNATTGQFVVLTSDATPAAVAGGATDELHVDIAFNRYTR